MHSNLFSAPRDPDRLYTFRQAAEELGLPYFKVQRAAKAGLIPTYRLLNGRRYVKLNDILERMSAATRSNIRW